MSEFFHLDVRTADADFGPPRVVVILEPQEKIDWMVNAFMDHPDHHVIAVSAAQQTYLGAGAWFATVTVIYQGRLS